MTQDKQVMLQSGMWGAEAVGTRTGSPMGGGRVVREDPDATLELTTKGSANQTET